MREHIAPNPQIAYMFLLRALEQIYEDGQLSQESPEVQEIIVRLANAASKMGESGPAEEMLRDAWNNVVDGQGSPVSSPVLVAKDGLVVAYEEKWRDEQIGRIAQVLGPLLIDRGDHQASIRTFGAALQAIKRLENRLDKAKEDADQDVAKEVDGLHLKQANFVTSLGEAFALAGDSKTAKALLESVLVDIRKRGDEHSSKAVDEWTCLDAIVMLDLAQVCNNMGEKDDSLAWANSALGITQENKGVRACDNCQEHLLRHIAQFADTSKEASMDH
ncbi:hypothetical protein GGI12_001767 [Dipsacomyces acuminosporus]|nr:hypothetical protein GGI12_001767 [Dipsacomyces acuminosporus]